MAHTNVQEARIKYTASGNGGVNLLAKLEMYLKDTGLDEGLIELVKLRSSEINGCAYCIDMHTKDARTRGESEQRLYGVGTWREAPFYSDRERAALAWTEAVTKISEHQTSDALYAEVRKHFSEKETLDLTMAIIAINSWNRLAISFKSPPRSYQPDHAVVKG